MKKVLVVDDELYMLNLLTVLLEEQGCKVVRAYNGREAINAARAEKPDLIFTDMMMPLMSGEEFCNALKNNPATKDIPIIVVSALDWRDTGCPADAFLTKPFDLDEFEELVAKYLPKSQRN